MLQVFRAQGHFGMTGIRLPTLCLEDDRSTPSANRPERHNRSAKQPAHAALAPSVAQAFVLSLSLKSVWMKVSEITKM